MVITPEQAPELSPVFKGKRGKFLFRLALWVTGIGKVNKLHQAVEDQGIAPGPDFAKGLLDQLGVDFRIGHPERLETLPEGPFIVIANHNYGHLDGICLVDLLGHRRPKTKVMVNEFLMWIHGLAPSFIAVNPVTKASSGTTATSISGVKSALAQLHGGEPLALFPSGAVADVKPRKGWILEEREWQDSAIRLIRKARVPIVPVRFWDRNSRFYYALGLLDYRVRFARLFHELFNKKGSRPRLGIGQTITVAQQDAVPEAEFKAFLRSSVYDMPLPQDFTLRSALWK